MAQYVYVDSIIYHICIWVCIYVGIYVCIYAYILRMYCVLSVLRIAYFVYFAYCVFCVLHILCILRTNTYKRTNDLMKICFHNHVCKQQKQHLICGTRNNLFMCHKKPCEVKQTQLVYHVPPDTQTHLFKRFFVLSHIFKLFILSNKYLYFFILSQTIK